MPKTRVPIKEVELPGPAARLVGLHPQTLHDAIERGDIKTLELAAGTRVVRITDVQEFMDKSQLAGRQGR